MKPMLSRRVAALIVLFFAPLAIAQQLIGISDADISRMGIVFAPVKAMDASAGARFPATVINSPDAVTTLSARFAGVIEQWLQSAGSTVEAGAPLAVIRSQEILDVQNAWIAAVAERERAEFELSKDESLLERGVISRQRLVQTRNRTLQSAFAEKSMRAQLALAGFDDAALKALRETGEGLGSYFLVAPAKAVLSQRIGNVGSFVEANMPLAYLNSGERRWVSIHVPGRFASEVALGQSLKVAESGESLTLRQKDYVIDSSNQTIELFAEFDAAGEEGSRFTTGQVISVVLPPSREGVLIPDRAVVHSGNVATVYVRTPAGVEARELPLLSVGAQYLAESGIAAGEMIAIQGAAVLKGIQLGLGSVE
jgi:multidrug efflux pump subunit AcrA (membrane-fusion protein)